MPGSRADGQRLRFLFDPSCPWAWTASLWVREVREVRPVSVEWGLYSLEYINRRSATEEDAERRRRTRLAFRMLALARELEGNEALDRLYLALGRSRHEAQRPLHDADTLVQALGEAGLDPSLYDEARARSELDEALAAEYRAAEATGAFGVPTVYLGSSDTPYYGPLIDTVPRGERAGELWDHFAALVAGGHFFELKRSR